jgi:predicted nucleic acid-binding protein
MKFDDLKRKDRVFIDANIFIYNFGGHSLECKEFLLKCAKNELKGNTSTLILAETLHRLMVGEAIDKRLITSKNPVQKLKQNPAIIKKLSIYNHNVQKIEEMNINILDLSLEIIHESAKIRNKEGLLTNDSLMAATMKQYNIDQLITNDDDFDNIEWINVYKPSDI